MMAVDSASEDDFDDNSYDDESGMYKSLIYFCKYLTCSIIFPDKSLQVNMVRFSSLLSNILSNFEHINCV